ncbi:hypothetical protein IU474_30120 [Nocardia otitidiscaviarum]|nr:hypothetical protein [Nocardia otitidiscaviarum]MBF6241306.1 hypothetical protein [Nocardia otitidiscaviarum]
MTIELGVEFELQIEGDLTLRTADGAVLHATSDAYASLGSELETLVSAAVTRADADEISGLTLDSTPAQGSMFLSTSTTKHGVL